MGYLWRNDKTKEEMTQYEIYDMTQYPPELMCRVDSQDQANYMIENVYGRSEYLHNRDLKIYAVDPERMHHDPRFITPEYVIYEALIDGSWFDMNKEQQDILLQACKHYHKSNNLENR